MSPAPSASASSSPSLAATWTGQRGIVRTFKLSYDLGAQMLGWLGGALGSELDDSALTGHLMRACLQYNELAKAPAATAAAAAAAASGALPPAATPKGAKRTKKAASAAASWVMSPDDDEEGEGLVGAGIDISGACVEEISLLQVRGLYLGGGADSWREEAEVLGWQR